MVVGGFGLDLLVVSGLDFWLVCYFCVCAFYVVVFGLCFGFGWFDWFEGCVDALLFLGVLVWGLLFLFGWFAVGLRLVWLFVFVWGLLWLGWGWGCCGWVCWYV